MFYEGIFLGTIWYKFQAIWFKEAANVKQNAFLPGIQNNELFSPIKTKTKIEELSSAISESAKMLMYVGGKRKSFLFFFQLEYKIHLCTITLHNMVTNDLFT